jgi:hypothetical protein
VPDNDTVAEASAAGSLLEGDETEVASTTTGTVDADGQLDGKIRGRYL